MPAILLLRLVFMSKLEKSVQELAIALEELSVRVEKNVLAAADHGESLATSRGQAQAAQKHAGKAARELARVITDLKAMIESQKSGQHSGRKE